MWVLTHIENGRRFYLLSDKHTVGRQGDLTIVDDTSVSRKHVTIYRSSSGVQIEDDESSYGTFLNDGIIQKKAIKPKTRVDMQVEAIVRFGRMKNEYRLENIEVKVCTSTLPPAAMLKLQKQLKVIDGVLLNNWSTECTHLVMPSVACSMNFMKSLTFGIPIVSPEFFDEYLRCVEFQNKRLVDVPLPNVNDFMPEIIKSKFEVEPHMLIANADRRHLFANKTFAFMQKHQMERFEPIISFAAGKCVSMDNEKVKKAFLCKPECIPVNYTASKNSQSSSDIESIVAYIQSKGRRLINKDEIALAIMHRSIDRSCNPDAKLKSDTVDKKKDALISGNRLNLVAYLKSLGLPSRNVPTNLAIKLMPPPQAPNRQSPRAAAQNHKRCPKPKGAEACCGFVFDNKRNAVELFGFYHNYE